MNFQKLQLGIKGKSGIVTYSVVKQVAVKDVQNERPTKFAFFYEKLN